MTATQVLFLFLKEECTIDEMRFFKNCIMKNPDNKYFRKRPLFKPIVLNTWRKDKQSSHKVIKASAIP